MDHNLRLRRRLGEYQISIFDPHGFAVVSLVDDGKVPEQLAGNWTDLSTCQTAIENFERAQGRQPPPLVLEAEDMGLHDYREAQERKRREPPRKAAHGSSNELNRKLEGIA